MQSIMVRPDCLRSAAQSLYHNTFVEPFRKDAFRNLSRIDHLEFKRTTDRGVWILGEDELEHGGLNPLEWLELIYLTTLWNVKKTYGDEPLGDYPKYHLDQGRDGTKEHPHKPALGHDVFDAVPGLIKLAKNSENGIFIDPTTTRGLDPLVQITPDFEFIAATESTNSWWILESFIEEALKFPQLMRRKATGRFEETIAWYKKHAKQYAEAISTAVSEDQINAFAHLLPPNSAILDVGANGGRDEAQFTQRGFRVTGLDLVHESLKIAANNNPDCIQVNCTMLTTPFPDNSFDGIWTHASMHHLNNFGEFKNALVEQRRILRPGGIIHIATQAKTDNLTTAIVVDELTKEPRQYLYVTAKELNKMLIGNGFSLIDLHEHQESDDEKGTQRKAVRWLVALARKK